MEITTKTDGGKFTVALSGRLDTTTAPQLETELKKSLDGVNFLELDLAGIDYISSAGLRVVLYAQKQMNHQGKMVIRNVAPGVLEVFDMTGFTSILTIE